MTDNQVAHVRNFLETYAPTTTPQIVVKALDYISPSERFPFFVYIFSLRFSPKSRSRSDSTSEKTETENTGGVDPNELAAALQK